MSNIITRAIYASQFSESIGDRFTKIPDYSDREKQARKQRIKQLRKLYPDAEIYGTKSPY